jgi:hypothetical protein
MTPVKREEPQFVICVKNRSRPASLELRKVYRVLPDEAALELGQIRVIDESGEDYLYPQSYFVLVDLPPAVGKAVLRADRLAAAR